MKYKIILYLKLKIITLYHTNKKHWFDKNFNRWKSISDLQFAFKFHFHNEWNLHLQISKIYRLEKIVLFFLFFNQSQNIIDKYNKSEDM